jgi:hypothetical protein
MKISEIWIWSWGFLRSRGVDQNILEWWCEARSGKYFRMMRWGIIGKIFLSDEVRHRREIFLKSRFGLGDSWGRGGSTKIFSSDDVRRGRENIFEWWGEASSGKYSWVMRWGIIGKYFWNPDLVLGIPEVEGGRPKSENRTQVTERSFQAKIWYPLERRRKMKNSEIWIWSWGFLRSRGVDQNIFDSDQVLLNNRQCVKSQHYVTFL